MTEYDSLLGFLTVCKNGHCKREFKLRDKNNPTKAILLSCHAMNLGSAKGVTMVVTDVTELMKAQDALQNLASFDPLTQLPNRYLFELILTKSLASTRRNNSLLALMYIDIDFFKNVNDLFGHETGDLFLKQVSRRLKQRVRLGDFVARLGGDEFAIIFEDIHNLNAAILAAEHLLEGFNHSIFIGDYEISSTLSIGIAIYPSDETTSDTIMKHADQALYQAKKSGRNCYKFYNNKLQKKLERYMLIVSHLRTAIKKNEFELFYQPKIDSKINAYSDAS